MSDPSWLGMDLAMVPYQDTFAQGFNCASVQLEAAASHNVNIDMMPIADLDVTAMASSRLPKLKPKAKAKAKQNADAGKRAKRNKKPQSRKPRQIKKILQKKSSASGARKTKKNLSSMAKAIANRSKAKETQPTVADTPVVTFGETHRLSRAFQWPQRLMRSLLGTQERRQDLHVRLHTEFSGAGTAEVAMEAIASASCGKITFDTVYAADWDASSQAALLTNVAKAPSCHVFSDIGGLMSEEMKDRVDQMVPVHVLISQADILRAIGNPDYMGHMTGCGSEQSAKPDDYNFESLFKKGKKVPGKLTEFGGVLKAKFLGNALKDYILVKEVP